MADKKGAGDGNMPYYGLSTFSRFPCTGNGAPSGPGAYPQVPPPQQNAGVQNPQQYGVVPGLHAAGSPYMMPGQSQLYPQGPPPTYDQALSHPAIVGQPMYHHHPSAAAAAAGNAATAAMYAAAAGYPSGTTTAYLGYPVATYAAAPMQYYPTTLGAYQYAAAAAAAAAAIQPGAAAAAAAAQMRPTIMIPNGYDAGARFDGIAQPVIPPAPPGVPHSAAQLAAMAGHQVALGQKKGSFLTGGSDGGYTFW